MPASYPRANHYDYHERQLANLLWQLLKGFLDHSWSTCGMTGQELTECLRQLKPKLKVIISSRYSCNLINSKGHADPTMRFLPKTYQTNVLARMLRELFG